MDITNIYTKTDCENYLSMKCNKEYYTRNEILENNISLKQLKNLDRTLERRNEIKNIFDDNKLEYKEYGECFLYVKYGKPPIETILETEINKIKMINNRRMKLANKLNKLDIELDENNKLCYEYINNIGCNGLNDTVRMIEIDNYTNSKKKQKQKRITINFD